MSEYEPGMGDIVGVPGGDVGEVVELLQTGAVGVRIIDDESPVKGQKTYYNRGQLTLVMEG